MADNNSTPQPGTPAAAPAAPASTPAPGTGTTAPQGTPSASQTPANPAPGDPQIPTDPAEAAEYWKNRHSEATETITRTTQQNARYKELYGDLDGGAAPANPQGQTPQPTPPAAAQQPQNGDAPVTASQLAQFKLEQRLERMHPQLGAHAATIQRLVESGITEQLAVASVAAQHNIALAPTSQPDIEGMPTTPAGGGAPTPTGSGLTREHEEALVREGIDPEAAKRAMPAINAAWSKVRK